MPDRRGLFAEISWFQVATSVLAAVTAAWIASRLGVAGTLIGAAVGSFVVTISTAFYGRTLDRGKTLIVQTTSGTVIQKAVSDGGVAEAFEEIEEVDHSPVERAEIVQEGKPRLRWKTIIATAVVVLLLALAAISTLELVSGRTLDGSDGTTIGDTFGGSRGSDDPEDDPEPEPSGTTPTPTAPTSTPAPSPTASTPTPTPTASTPTPTPTPTDTPE